MITQTRPAYYDALRYAEYCGLSGDNKDTIDAHNGDKFYEIDTAIIYRYNEDSKEWIAQPDDTTAVDTGIPPMTSDTAGHFLSNDGNVTHWQEFASADFIIHLIEQHDGTYTADKTWVQIKSAFEGKENIAVSIGNGDTRLPLMNAELAANGDAGFTFGYTQVTVDGQLVSTRAVNYSHREDEVAEDYWTDADQVGEYLSTSGGALGGHLSMGANNITDVQELSTADTHPLYIGNVIHQTSDGVRITSTTNNEAAVLSPDSQNVYRPINVGGPTAPNHAVNLAYLTQEVKDETATKKVLNYSKNTGAIQQIWDGVYLATACDDVHSGLAIVYVCGQKSTIYKVGDLVNWDITDGAMANSIFINNTSSTTDLNVYIVALGAGSAI